MWITKCYCDRCGSAIGTDLGIIYHVSLQGTQLNKPEFSINVKNRDLCENCLNDIKNFIDQKNSVARQQAEEEEELVKPSNVSIEPRGTANAHSDIITDSVGTMDTQQDEASEDNTDTSDVHLQDEVEQTEATADNPDESIDAHEVTDGTEENLIGQSTATVTDKEVEQSMGNKETSGKTIKDLVLEGVPTAEIMKRLGVQRQSIASVRYNLRKRGLLVDDVKPANAHKEHVKDGNTGIKEAVKNESNVKNTDTEDKTSSKALDEGDRDKKILEALRKAVDRKPYCNVYVKSKSGRNVDVGKVLALNKAGWSIIAISEDVGSDEDTVKRIIDGDMNLVGSQANKNKSNQTV